MARDWDEHYLDAANLDFAPEPLLVMAADLLPAGKALDLACGPGRNALYLAGLGWRVTAVDRSPAAVRMLRERSTLAATIEIHQADLERGEFPIAVDSFDLVCDILYLQRNLFEAIRRAVRPGGVFAGAILLAQPGRDSAFRLAPGELRQEFASWKILYYSEAGAARILARKA
ncbi:MAG TPA: class I SAM-dependent methyltransferase [Bryobacteraceae bacterium]|nr:class I SAM-dependent methyltransferase [Bryobacteraceae bacterium]